MNGKTCTKCNQNVSLSYHQYCYDCLRISRGQKTKPKFRRDGLNKTMCSRCKERPRLPYHGYCQKCKNKSTKAWAMRLGGWWSALSTEQKRKATVRSYIGLKARRGQIERRPCVVCGKPSEFHHLDYKDRTLNVAHLCHKHHVEEERRKSLLTKNSPHANDAS